MSIWPVEFDADEMSHKCDEEKLKVRFKLTYEITPWTEEKKVERQTGILDSDKTIRSITANSVNRRQTAAYYYRIDNHIT
ncbi:hypothetical protein L596_021028 [Steinernema carpocapsae]|uniref:Uncharacterized protein n=1 Tax=Steinernema carpocapsae TaxID=34508 RepID=A0A4U5MVX4_STECR|nr:hypothetical protein L596_021028 [Steinernema carpocapsae]